MGPGELIVLGLAAHLYGKSNAQILEAVNDAQQQRFERLKEFGFTVAPQGMHYVFTHQGVPCQVEAHPAAIRAYLLTRFRKAGNKPL